MKKTIRRILGKIRRIITPKPIKQIDAIKSKLDSELSDINRLICEFVAEQRQHDARNTYGGVLQLSETEIATKIFSGAIMYLDPRDIAITPHIVFSGVWEKWVTMAWLSLLKTRRSAVVFDVGSNNGYYGMLAAQELDKKKGKVVLFEPNPNLIPYIDKTLSVNWLHENATIVPSAISDKVGTAELKLLKDYVGSSSIQPLNKLDSYLSHKMDIKAEKVVKVQTMTIDSYCKQERISKVDIVIMDIEGYEEKAYRGMKNIVASSPGMIFLLEFTKDAYEHPDQFYRSLLEDFGHVYSINEDGNLERPQNDRYEAVVAKVDDYIMLVFSKRALDKYGNIL